MNKFTPEKRSKIMSAIRSRDTLPEGFEGQDRVPHILEKGSDKVAYDILKQLADGPRRPAELRAALGIASANFFTARYLTPLTRSRATSRLLEAKRIAICPASSIGFCARERRWSVPNPTTSTPPLGSVPRSP